MMKFKHVYSILFFILGWFCTVWAQQPAFEVLLLDYDMDFSITFCCETADGYYLVVPETDCKVLKISQEGEVVGEMEYIIELDDNEIALISGMIDIPGDPSHHVILVEPHDNDTGVGSTFHIVRFNDDLEYDPAEVIAVDLSEYVSKFTIILPPRYFIDDNNNLCFASLAVKQDGLTSLMYVSVSPEGEATIAFDNNHFGFDDPNLEVCHFVPKGDYYEMVVKYNKTPKRGVCLYQVSQEFVSDSICCLIDNYATLLHYDNQIDTLFHATSAYRDYYSPLWISESTFLLPTRVAGFTGVNTSYGVGIWKLDAEFNLLDQVFFDVNNGKNNKEFLYAWNPLIRNGEDIYFCYTTYKGAHQPMQTVVCKLDTDLNIVWKRWYGGESEFHEIEGFVPTSDGGCLLSGVGNPDPLQMDYHTYPYVLKITPEGYCSVKENKKSPLKPYTFFPNPVANVFHIDYSPDVEPSLVEILDMNGCSLRSQNHDIETINMDGLPAGAYTLRVLMKDGTVFSDKVVKD